MIETQQHIKKNNNNKDEVRIIQIRQRVKNDNCFKIFDSFYNSYLLALTSDISNQEVREMKMEVLSKGKKTSFNAVARKLIVHVLESGITPEEII